MIIFFGFLTVVLLKPLWHQELKKSLKMVLAFFNPFALPGFNLYLVMLIRSAMLPIPL
jgi:hypothetical protein